MKVLVTVGTTAFDELIEAVDTGPFAKSALLQIADGVYTPKNSEWFRFDSSIQQRINEADVVVCHCGSASTFGLLQANIVPVVVPNLTRRDKHQVELANWLELNNYCLVAMQPQDVNAVLERYFVEKDLCVPFDVKRFFWEQELNQIIQRELN